MYMMGYQHINTSKEIYLDETSESPNYKTLGFIACFYIQRKYFLHVSHVGQPLHHILAPDGKQCECKQELHLHNQYYQTYTVLGTWWDLRKFHK